MFFGCQYNHLFIHRVNNHLLHVKHWEFLGNSSDDFLFLWSPLIIDRLSYISEGYHLDAKPAELVAYPSLEYSERVFCALVLFIHWCSPDNYLSPHRLTTPCLPLQLPHLVDLALIPLLNAQNSSASETSTFTLFQSPDLQLFIARNCFSKTINTTLQISENFSCLELSNSFLSPVLLSEIFSPTTYFCFHFLSAHFCII